MWTTVLKVVKKEREKVIESMLTDIYFFMPFIKIIMVHDEIKLIIK